MAGESSGHGARHEHDSTQPTAPQIDKTVETRTRRRLKPGMHGVRRLPVANPTTVAALGVSSSSSSSSSGSLSKRVKALWVTEEHINLGDNLVLKVPKTDLSTVAGIVLSPNQNRNQHHEGTGSSQAWTTIKTSDFKFRFHDLDDQLNEQELSYGQINGLAGDFYGTYQTISGHGSRPFSPCDGANSDGFGDDEIEGMTPAAGSVITEQVKSDHGCGPTTGLNDDDVEDEEQEEEQRIRRFLHAWNLLAVRPESVTETKAILTYNQQQQHSALAIDDRHYNNKNDSTPKNHDTEPSPASPPLPLPTATTNNNHHETQNSTPQSSSSPLIQTLKWYNMTKNRFWNNQSYPSYIGLLLINDDHFGSDAHAAYQAGHKAALRLAAAAGQTHNLQKLLTAYAMNAFADHFLEDAFSAGHIRTPRRALHGSSLIPQVLLSFLSSSLMTSLSHYRNILPDLCANLMHDEDSSQGVQVQNRNGDKWTCYGDDHLFLPHSTATLEMTKRALSISVDEIWQAYEQAETASSSSSLLHQRAGALDLVPFPLPNPTTANFLPPLFRCFVDQRNDNNNNTTAIATATAVTGSLQQRISLGVRNKWSRENYTPDWWYLTTWLWSWSWS